MLIRGNTVSVSQQEPHIFLSSAWYDIYFKIKLTNFLQNMMQVIRFLSYEILQEFYDLT